MKQNKKREEVRFEEGDKVRIISKNIEGVIISVDSVNMIYENCTYRVRVGKYTTPVTVSDLEKIANKLNEELDKSKTIEEQLALSFYAHYELVNIHPFLDGNGRTSRLLMNFIQHRYGLPLGIIFAEDKAQYYEALESVRETETFDKYNEFMLSQYQKHLSNEIEREKQQRKEEDKEIEWKPKLRL